LSGKGTQVAVLDRENRVKLVPVTIVSDTGSEVLIADGITANDRVVANPGGTIVDGALVEVVMPPPTPAVAGSGKPGASSEGSASSKPPTEKPSAAFGGSDQPPSVTVKAEVAKPAGANTADAPAAGPPSTPSTGR
jgi:hypothetical protein